MTPGEKIGLAERWFNCGRGYRIYGIYREQRGGRRAGQDGLPILRKR
jgi:hypothetical protein